LDAGAAAPGGGDGVGFAASGGRECWSASSAMWAAGLQRADGTACGPFRRPSARSPTPTCEALVPRPDLRFGQVDGGGVIGTGGNPWLAVATAFSTSLASFPSFEASLRSRLPPPNPCLG
jgi:hypothetical protein